MCPDAPGSVPSDAGPGVPRRGDVVGGKFVVERVLGVGGMGIVLAAHHSHLEQTVAIKFLRHDAAKDEAAVSRFLREARAVAALQSEHVVRVMDAGRLEDGLPYLVMEYLSGTDLDQVLAQRGRLPLEEVIEYLLQTMEAVAEAHAAGIVHRDLKPSNLFLAVRPDGARLVKVLDFGISKALDTAGRQAVSLTATSMTLGSPLYMSPEQVRSSKSVDARTDIWALGIIAYELLAGVQPFEAETVTSLCAKIVADEPVPLRSIRPDVPEDFEAVVMRCLQKNVTSRYQSVSELATALRPFASAEGLVSVSRIRRTGGGLLPTLASAQEGRASTPPSPSAPIATTDSAAGYAETVASWQTTGTRRGKQAIAATVGTVGGVALLACAILGVGKWSHGSHRSSQPEAAPTAIAADMAAVSAPTVTDVALVPLPPGPSAAPRERDRVEAQPLASASAPIASSPPAPGASARRTPVVKTPTGSSVSAKPPSAKTQDDLLLDRK